MDFLRMIYILLFFANLILIVYKKKNISFSVIYFLSSVIYYYNAFVGKIYIGKINRIGTSDYAIAEGTYVILIINLIISLFVILSERERYRIRAKCTLTGEKIVMKMFIVFVMLLAVYMSVSYNVFNRVDYNKSELAYNTGRLGTYFKYLASFVFVYVFVQRNIKFGLIWKFMALFPIISTFFFGNRSYIVIALLAVLFDYIFIKCQESSKGLYGYIRENKKVILITVILFAVTLVLKGVTNALFRGDYASVWERLGNIEYYVQVFKVSEPNTIMKNLDTIVVNDYRVKPSSYIALWAYAIPFVTGRIEKMMGVKSFTRVYQRALYGNDTNNASTYLGEGFANGGYFALTLVIIFYMFLLYLLFRAYRNCRTNITKAGFLLMGIDAAFYIQRNSMAFEFSRLRDYIYIMLILLVVLNLMRSRYSSR